MAVLLAVSTNGPLRGRWIRVLEAAGHRVTAMTPDAFGGYRPDPEADACLFDLGEWRGGDAVALGRLLLAQPQLRYLAMTAVPEALEGMHLLRAGARGYCNRRMSDQALVVAVATVLAGEIWAGRQVTDYLLRATLGHPAERVPPAATLDGLTDREREIALLVGAGRSNKVIAAQTGIAERTVKAHLNAVFRKTGLRNRVQLALAVAQGTSPDGRLAQG